LRLDDPHDLGHHHCRAGAWTKTGVDPTTEDDLMPILEAECRQGETVLASTHHLARVAEHFTRLLSLEPDRRRRWAGRLMRNPDVLRATFGGHLIEVDHGGVVLQGLRWHAFR